MEESTQESTEGIKTPEPDSEDTKVAPTAVPADYYISFTHGINDNSARALMDLIGKIVNNKRPDHLYFLFASRGGSVDAGIALYHFLDGLPCDITMHNTSAVDSISNVIFLAGDNRYAAPGSSFLFHGVTTTFNAKSSVRRNRLSEILSRLKADERKIIELVSGNCALTKNELEQLYQQGEAKNLEFALEKGIISEIRKVNIPPDAKIITVA